MDYYAILGIAPGASVADVQRAYRRLSRRHHPRLNPGDRAAEALFRRITEAYETLVDAERRQRYDAGALGPVARREQAFEFTGFDFSVKAHGPQAATFSELFAEALHPVRPPDPGEPQPGADLHATLGLSFEEALTGVDRQVTVTRHVPCGVCHGTGQVRADEAKCSQCHGTGHVRWARGHMVFTKACAACGASGRERQRRCAVCAGHGRSPRTEAVLVRVPPGVFDGTQLRIVDRGHAGSNGARAGDLYVHIKVQPHPVLRRDHDDLHLVVPVAVHEAALGARIEVPSFDGPVRVKIPPGTQGGQRFRITGRGVPTMAGGRGDLFVEVRIALPPLTDERSKELMRELARLNRADVRQELARQFASTPRG